VGGDEHLWVSARSDARLEDFVKFFLSFGFLEADVRRRGVKIQKKWREKGESG
jgi:hypothetical protein